MEVPARAVRKGVEAPDAEQAFLDGSRRVRLDLPGGSIGRGVYRPGWRWSQHAGAVAGKPAAAHLGYVISGRMGSIAPSGEEVIVGPGEAFSAPPGSDAYVIGDESCVALDFAAGPGTSPPPK